MSTEHLGVDVPRLCSSEFGSWIPGDVAKSVVRRCRKGWNQPFERPEKRAPGWWNPIQLYRYYNMIITNHCKDPYEPTSISWKVGVFFCVAHLSNEKTSMFTLGINGWNIIMEVWFRSFSPVKICRFHGHLPECRSYSGVSLCFTISGLYQDILRCKDDNSLSGSLLTDQHIQQKCNRFF